MVCELTEIIPKFLEMLTLIQMYEKRIDKLKNQKVNSKQDSFL